LAERKLGRMLTTPPSLEKPSAGFVFVRPGPPGVSATKKKTVITPLSYLGKTRGGGKGGTSGRPWKAWPAQLTSKREAGFARGRPGVQQGGTRRRGKLKN